MSLADKIHTGQVPADLLPVRPPTAQDAATGFGLRTRLVASDALALGLAWSIAVLTTVTDRRYYLTAVVVAALVVLGIWVLHVHELYLSRISAVRALEISRIGRSAVLLGLLGLAISRVLKVTLTKTELVTGTSCTLVLLLVSRSAYRAWLGAARRSGRYLRDVVLVGANAEGAALLDLVNCHPDAGYRVVGVVGERDQAVANGMGNLWCGLPRDTVQVLRNQQADSVLITVGSLSPVQLNDMVRQLQAHRAHIQLSNGVRGIDYRRLRAAPIAHEPMFYLESPVLSRRQFLAKRALDIFVSGFGLLITAPLFAAIAIAIKLTDRGPIFFKQIRVGQDGRTFKVYKFRTMVVDAEARLAALKETNERHGPLFKMDRDPRVTRIGHILRDSSLDEMPQMINVLRGEMSLVGPRPALPAEVALFDDELLNRTKVPPGITGLWQVEARDNPAFSAYRRLDLFYVDNWSVGLDLVILLATGEQVIARLVTTVLRRRRTAAPRERPVSV
jgi:exopolysaccharide biosynthesis polyprenyl glycosylphosphotransferase